jgi:hypothetical protein
MPNASAILFDFRKRIAGDPDAKRQFHRRARRQLIELAEELNFTTADYDLRSNEGGIAVSGEVTLHAERLYVQVSQPATGNDTGVLFRDCQGRRDYTGGRNNFASLDLLHRPAALAALIRRHVTQTSLPHPQQRRLTMSNDKLTAAELDQFTGSEHWYRHALVRDILYTDGAKYVADQGGAHWLLDEIAFAQRARKAVAAEEFQVWKLTVNPDRTALLCCEDGNGRTVFEKPLEYTDFPADSVELWFENNTIYLPSEH